VSISGVEEVSVLVACYEYTMWNGKYEYNEPSSWHNIQENLNILKLISLFKQLPYVHK
jgi:hypothetical protein